MPAVILLDSSLSMILSDGQDPLVNRKKLAEFGLEQFLDELHRLNVPEQVALVQKHDCFKR